MDKKELQKKNAIDFLLWETFKIDQKITKLELIKKSIKEAYYDATLMGAYNAIIGKHNKKKSDDIFDELLNETKDVNLPKYIDNLVLDTPDNFNKDHKKLCDYLVSSYEGIVNNETRCFTYGNAQKWVNMTLKNLYILCGVCEITDDSNFCEAVLKKSACFHVPVDSYIIQAIWEKVDSVSIPLSEKGERKGAYNADKVKGWSTWNSTDYISFQRELRNYINTLGITSMEWESNVWIEISQKRAAK